MTALMIVVALVGAWLLVSALANWEWYTAITDFAVVETLFGDGAARWLCGIVGLVLIGVGIAGAAR